MCIASVGAVSTPEQCNGAEQVDDRTDVYALGVIMYQLVSSKLPFDAPAACVIMANNIRPTGSDGPVHVRGARGTPAHGGADRLPLTP